MIIWSGLGFLPVVFLIGSFFLFNTNTDRQLAFAFIVSGCASGLLGWYLRTRPGRVLIDKQTGQQVVFRHSHSLFFVPMFYWGPVFIAAGVYYLFKSF